MQEGWGDGEGDARVTRDLEYSNTKNQPWDQSQPWECLQNPRHSHATWFDFQFSFSSPLAASVSVHRHHLPHLKCESEGTISPSPTHGHFRYVII